MRRRLFLKFILAYCVFGILGFAFIALISSHLTYRYLVHKEVNSLYLEASLIAASYSDSSSDSSGLFLSEEIVKGQMQAVSTFLQANVWLSDREGRIISNTGSNSMAGRRIPEFDPLMTGAKNYTMGRYHGLFAEDVLTVAASIIRDYRVNGYVIIHMPMNTVIAEQNRILNIAYITGLAIFLLSLIILVVFYFIVYRPLRKITEGATSYAAGNYSHRISVKAEDEMGYLAGTLNFMSDEIAKADDYQRQFIANVSHDIRSPLTSIKGYLEAILDGTIPPQMERKYLSRLISETERLSKLTQSMLTLGAIDQKGFLTRTGFDINRMIRDLCAGFEMVCLDKKITFELIFAEKKEMVYADYGKMQQVLYNLTDNALKFSYPDSKIRISTGLRGEGRVFVSVKDTGIGIPKKDIQKIWDRFYKVDHSRGKDRQGTGLGLAIVKSIINAHGENIDCVSTEGAGTEFTFTLPAAPLQLADG